MLETIYMLHIAWITATNVVIFTEQTPARPAPGKAPVTTYEECVPIAAEQKKQFKDAIDRAIAKEGKCIFSDVKVTCHPAVK